VHSLGYTNGNHLNGLQGVVIARLDLRDLFHELVVLNHLFGAQKMIKKWSELTAKNTSTTALALATQRIVHSRPTFPKTGCAEEDERSNQSKKELWFTLMKN
jgi:hypothetical protein